MLQQNPAPTLSRISPAFAMAGVASVTVTLVGTNFLADSVAQRNGNDLPTTWRSATQLEARIEGSLLATLGSASITVFNAPPGGGTSSAKTFLVIDPTTGLPPTDLRIMSPSPGPDLLLAWAPPPDIAAANGYRLRRYATPYRNTVPLERDLPNTAVTAQVPLILGTSYFDLVVVRGAGVQSLPTRLVKVSTTTNHAAGDVNGDNLVDGRDLMDVLAAFGSHAGETEWNPSADCNGDGVVNGDDVVRVTINLGSRQ